MSEDTNKDEVARLRAIADNPNYSAVMRDNAQKQLDFLSTQGRVEVMSQQAGAALDPNAQAILDALNNAISKGYQSSGDIRKEIEDILKIRKIVEGDLSDSLKALITSSRKLELTLTQISGNVTQTNASEAFIGMPLTQLLLSDMKSRNNSYLYGGAGTGKTYSAEKIASLLGWTLVTINCSQYTSPLDILGGQTIEGYQEGRLSMAWSNTIYDASGRAQKVDGCVLLLDELPKIDPNTAGLLNDALAKVKPTDKDPATGMWVRPQIRNGKGQLLDLGNLYVIATGNVPLNTIDPDYEANFKQDLSLQDRFIGSTYKVKINYKYELENIMAGYAFIWIFFSKVRLSIARNKAGGQAFVSLRIMVNARETYRFYRDNLDDQKSGFKDLITNPKTLIDTIDAFFDLFKPAVKAKIIEDVDYEGFKKILKEKDKMPYKHSKLEQGNDFNTKNELKECAALIDEMEKEL
jgi:hypothetical protein